MLKGVSRSFYLSLRLLPAPDAGAASLAYLLARTSDTLADTAAAPADAPQALPRRLRARHGVGRRPAALAGIAAQRGCGPPGTAAAGKLRRSHRMARTPARSRSRARPEVVGIIVGGQKLDLFRFAAADREHPVSLADDAELEDYAWRVAGCVGAFWTKLGFATMGSGFSHAPGIRFDGKGHHLWQGTATRQHPARSSRRSCRTADVICRWRIRAIWRRHGHASPLGRAGGGVDWRGLHLCGNLAFQAAARGLRAAGDDRPRDARPAARRGLGHPSITRKGSAFAGLSLAVAGPRQAREVTGGRFATRSGKSRSADGDAVARPAAANPIRRFSASETAGRGAVSGHALRGTTSATNRENRIAPLRRARSPAGRRRRGVRPEFPQAGHRGNGDLGGRLQAEHGLLRGDGHRGHPLAGGLARRRCPRTCR